MRHLDAARRTLRDVLLAYLDESYDDDYYWMAALVCPEHTLQPLANALDEIVERTSTQHGVPLRAELHGHDLFHAKAQWNALDGMVKARIAVYDDVFKVVAAHDIAIILRGLDRKLHEERYATPFYPHRIVLMHLLERIHDYANAKGQVVLAIADQIDNEDEHRKRLWFGQNVATEGWRSRRLTSIVDTLHFVPSHHSRLVQAADMIAFMHRRMQSRAPQNPRAVRANERLWSIIEPRVEHNHCWRPRSRDDP